MENEKKWEENWRRLSAIERRLSNVETTLAASIEAQFTRYVWEDLKEEIRARGETVIRRTRNARIGNTEIDLLVETNQRIYVIEVKTRPRIDDVGTLLAKAEAVKTALGREVVPILAGAWIGEDVENYAKAKGVAVYSY